MNRLHAASLRRLVRHCRFGRALLATLVLAAVSGPSPAAGLRYSMRAENVEVPGVRIRSLELARDESVRVQAAGIRSGSHALPGTIALDCALTAGMRCRRGTLLWSGGGSAPVRLNLVREGRRIELTNGVTRIRYQHAPGDRVHRAEVIGLPLQWVPASVLRALGLSELGGRLALELDVGAERRTAGLRMTDVAFDTPDGRFAGAGLGLALELDWRVQSGAVSARADWTAGEALLGPLYLPAPSQALTIGLEAERLDAQDWRVGSLSIKRPGVLALQGHGRVALDPRPSVQRLGFDSVELDLHGLWQAGLRSIAAAAGWSELSPGGRIRGSLAFAGDGLESVRLELDRVGISDAAGRVAVEGLEGKVDWERGTAVETPELSLNIGWRSGHMYRIPLGSTEIALAGRADGTLGLTRPWVLPVLDGRLVVERLQWRDWLSEDRELTLDATLEPIALDRLSRVLGWTEFGGTLSGDLTGLRVSGDAIEFAGGFRGELFDGSARVTNLAIERPFGALPALAADIEFEALDLALVTGAFEFGRIQGLMSGHIRDLRLLDWRPVMFDAWFATLDDSPTRRISQRAVDALSAVGGGGGAALSGTLLRWFDDFPYRRIGLGCRLRNNVCRMRGLRDTESGGYMILEGRSLPSLNIVGFQRRVDWPRLLAQLAAATANTGP